MVTEWKLKLNSSASGRGGSETSAGFLSASSPWCSQLARPSDRKLLTTSADSESVKVFRQIQTWTGFLLWGRVFNWIWCQLKGFYGLERLPPAGFSARWSWTTQIFLFPLLEMRSSFTQVKPGAHLKGSLSPNQEFVFNMELRCSEILKQRHQQGLL